MVRTLLIVDTGWQTHLFQFENDICVSGPWRDHYLEGYGLDSIILHYSKDKHNLLYVMDASLRTDPTISTAPTTQAEG